MLREQIIFMFFCCRDANRRAQPPMSGRLAKGVDGYFRDLFTKQLAEEFSCMHGFAGSVMRSGGAHFAR
ncbi:hypothetical protein DF035_36760 [Burkholderia contaminans]|nr:hypothetical protein DF035_36760 [Burkholderia contaminans]